MLQVRFKLSLSDLRIFANSLNHLDPNKLKDLLLNQWLSLMLNGIGNKEISNLMKQESEIEIIRLRLEAIRNNTQPRRNKKKIIAFNVKYKFTKRDLIS